MTATTHDLPGWERLRHGGLLLDGVRLQAIARSGHVLAPLDGYTERKLRQRAGAMLDGAGAGAGSGDGGGSGVGVSGAGGESGSAEPVATSTTPIGCFSTTIRLPGRRWSMTSL